jgi:bacteriorhodopsin
MEEKPLAPSSKTRLVLSIIFLVVGLIMLGTMEEKPWAWIVTGVGAFSIVYNVIMIQKEKGK